MTSLKLYNSLSKRVETFRPKKGKQVRVYHCGPTVYRRQHVGNLRRFLFADFLHRTLKFFGYEILEITNITDVGHLTQDDIDAGEDKLEKEARERRLTPQVIAAEQTDLFLADLSALNIERSDRYPKATEHIADMIALIQTLIERRHAYVASSGVYFDVQSFPAYGRLSGNTLEHLTAGARVPVRGDKRHPADFALWKLAEADHLQQWDSPWGRGYPGWHIECSAMSLKYLDSEIDIHTGGEDNRFPHHENEIAQSEGATGKPFVRFWMHNRHLRLEGKKLAKREGSLITLETIREKGYSPLAFRLLVFGSHYRSPLDFSWEALAAAEKQLETLRQFMRRLREQLSAEPEGEADETTVAAAAQALGGDLNTPRALGILMEYIHAAQPNLSTAAPRIYATLQKLDAVLGVMQPLEKEIAALTVPSEIDRLVKMREDARRQRNFSEADRLRKELAAKGYQVEDTATGPRVIPTGSE